jgi:hypothetical protein
VALAQPADLRSGLAAIAFVTMLWLATAALMRRGTRCSVSGV